MVEFSHSPSRQGITTAINGKNIAAWRLIPANGRERTDANTTSVSSTETTSGVDGKPTLRMKLNAPTVPPTPPAASLVTMHPLGASHRGYDTLHRTGPLLFEKGPRHNGRGAGFRQGACLVWRPNTASDNYRNIQVR